MDGGSADHAGAVICRLAGESDKRIPNDKTAIRLRK
jgi:hypothetical protein